MKDFQKERWWLDSYEKKHYGSVCALPEHCRHRHFHYGHRAGRLRTRQQKTSSQITRRGKGTAHIRYPRYPQTETRIGRNRLSLPIRFFFFCPGKRHL